MPLIAGIDEVGYGPRLGPLVVTATLFQVPSPDADLWRLLGHAVSRAPSRDRAVCVCDSKKLHRHGDLAPVERTAAAFWRARPGAAEATFFEFLAAHGPEGADALRGYRWYEGPPLSLPFVADPADVAASAETLRASMRAAGVAFAGARSAVADVREFNAGVARAGNKSDFLFQLSSRLYRWLWETAAAPEPLTVVVGKQGGRAFYADKLQALFSDAFVMVSDEGRDRSVYSIEARGRRMRIAFAAEAEDSSFAVALASILAKYTREGLMEHFNRWWRRHKPDLRPTAGYYEDAARFLEETEALRRELGVEDGELIRER
jgi:hypothetical protein